MSAPDIRFDCRYCNKPVKVMAKEAGKKVKCPYCKNPVQVPALEGYAVEDVQVAQPAGGGGRSVSDRPISRRRSGFPIAKIVVIGGLLAAAYFGYQWFQGQKAKPLGTLFEELAQGNPANGPIISSKLADAVADGKTMPKAMLDVCIKFARHEESGVRKVAVEGLGASQSLKAMASLKKALERDKEADVRREAAIALGVIGAKHKNKDLIGYLIGRMEGDSDSRVKGGIRDALVRMTGQKVFKAHHSEWKAWWSGKTKARFKFPE